jgi:RF-1 domain
LSLKKNGKRGLKMGKFFLPSSDEKLLEECQVDPYRIRSLSDTAVRLRHLPTGIVVTCHQENSRHLNKIICLKKIRLRVAEMNRLPEVRVTTKILSKSKERILFKAKLSESKKARHKSKQIKFPL